MNGSIFRIGAVCLLLAAGLLGPAAPCRAEKAPAVLSYGREEAACHLAAHREAYTHDWDGTLETAEDGTRHSALSGDNCGEYGHVHCYGRGVDMWDTPKKGPNRVLYYAHTKVGELNPGDAFQLVDLTLYRGVFYAQVRVYVDGMARLSGWVNADYIGCDCPDNPKMLEIGVYETDEVFLAEPREAEGDQAPA